MTNSEDFLVLKRVYLNPKKHNNTGNVRVNGLITDHLPHRLEICIYENTPNEIYLLRLESTEKTDDSIDDTWHPSIKSAIKQAKYEFNVNPKDWEDLAH